jgi:rSAM-associated Gly-rich repeat protein
MAFLSRSRLLGLLLLLALPLEGTAALAAAAVARASSPPVPEQPASLEERLQRIAAAVRERDPQAAERPARSDGDLAFAFLNGPRGGFANGGFRNGGWRNGGFYNGGFRNGGGWRNGGGAWRNGGFRNAW